MFNFLKRIKRNYVSEIDIFLHAFDESHPTKLLSQQRERTKYERIAALRDCSPLHATLQGKDKEIWQNF